MSVHARRFSSANSRQSSLSRESANRGERLTLCKEANFTCTHHHRIASNQSQDFKIFPKCLRSGPSPPSLPPVRPQPNQKWAFRLGGIPMEPTRGPSSVDKAKTRITAPKIKSFDHCSPNEHGNDMSHLGVEKADQSRLYMIQELTYLKELDRKLDEIVGYVKRIDDRVNRIQADLRHPSHQPTSISEKRIITAVSTVLQDKLESQAWKNQMIDNIIFALDRWWANMTSKAPFLTKMPNMSPILPVTTNSPAAKRLSLACNSLFGRTPGPFSCLNDSLTLSENGTDWGGTSCLFSTPLTNLMPGDKRNLVSSHDAWNKAVGTSGKDESVFPATSPLSASTLNTIKKSPQQLSRDSTTHTTPSAGGRMTVAKEDKETPKPSSKTLRSG